MVSMVRGVTMLAVMVVKQPTIMGDSGDQHPREGECTGSQPLA
jgi:hypothetical protein